MLHSAKYLLASPHMHEFVQSTTIHNNGVYTRFVPTAKKGVIKRSEKKTTQIGYIIVCRGIFSKTLTARTEAIKFMRIQKIKVTSIPEVGFDFILYSAC